MTASSDTAAEDRFVDLPAGPRIEASGDRTAELRRITAPTLVVHGDVDRMVHPSGGRATAAAIPGARHVEIPGMSHHLAPGVVDRLVELVTDLAHGSGDAR